MNNKIEPGVLCLVYGLQENPRNNGKLVTAKRRVASGELPPETGRLYAGEGSWLCEGDLVSINGYVGLAFVRPCNLMPLHPPAEEPSQCARQSKLIPA